MSRHAAVQRAKDMLEAAGHEAADFAARSIMAHVTRSAPSTVLLIDAADLNPEEASQFADLVQQVANGTPLFRAIGVREFHGLDFALSPDTLEPRDDTETLIEAVMAQSLPAASRFADLGTGSGIVAISLLHEMPDARAVATDIVEDALRMANENATRNGVGERFTTVQGSWCAPLEGLFDFIASNPPYIANSVVDVLDASVVEHDPRRALDGGADGLDAYRAILPQASIHLVAGGFLALEIGYDQAESVTTLAEGAGWQRVALHRDLQGHDRALVFVSI